MENGSQLSVQRGKGHVPNFILVLLLLAGDIHLNPGPFIEEPGCSIAAQVPHAPSAEARSPLGRQFNAGRTATEAPGVFGEELLHQSAMRQDLRYD